MTLILFTVGLLAGTLLAWRLLGRWLEAAAQSRLDRWVLAEAGAMRADSLVRSQAVLKGRAYEQMAPLEPVFPFDPADARFLGSPVDFVVFDGCREVRAGTRRDLRRIVLVDIKTGSASLTTVQRRIRDCIAAGRFSWQLLDSSDGAPVG